MRADWALFCLYALFCGFVCYQLILYYTKESTITGGTCLAGEYITSDSRGVPYCQPRHFTCTQGKGEFTIILPDNATCK